jgi:methylenetetrahydrofolate dehydrogenase (NADP+)/methenyltetrahydrofolate cyclohydrolase
MNEVHMAQRMDGRALAADIRECVKERVGGLSPARPGILLIRVGEDPASQVYVRGKEKAAREVGIESRVEVWPESSTEGDLLRRLDEANRDPSIHGVLVQLPLPRQIRPEIVAESIVPEKDVDGLHPFNQGRLALGRAGIVPCTPLGVLALLHRYRIPLRGKRVAVLGRSSIVGRPLSLLLSQKTEWADATVTLCHSRSGDLRAVTREADVVIAAMGRARSVTGEMIRPGAAVVDVGIHRIEDGSGGTRLVGDVDESSVDAVAGALSPVPGGVGPLTVAMLMANTLEACERSLERAGEPIWRVAARG